MPRRKESITLEDPRALRALAHPARQRLVSELFGGRVLTATQAAELVGLTPSAVSHHLRALEKWGLANRATATSDGRERPWQGTAKTLNLKPAGGAASYAALHSVVATMIDDLARDLDSFMGSADSEPWKRCYQGLSRGELWLTREETAALSARMAALVEEFEQHRTHQQHPADARRASFTWSLVPKRPAPAE